jgi:hypothetical protein
MVTLMGDDVKYYFGALESVFIQFFVCIIPGTGQNADRSILTFIGTDL